MIWKVLGIEKTKDEEAIKTAYRNKLREVNPEDDEEGFKELRRSYEEALDYAASDDSLHNTENGGMLESPYPKNEIDLWIDRIDLIYRDVKTRTDRNKWKGILHDSVCEDLDTELEAAEKLLVYFMSHTFMPQEIWQLVDKRFQYIESYNQWKEKFPENFLHYVKWQIEHPNFIDFELFDGKTDANVDDYINTLYEEKTAFEAGDMQAVKRLLAELNRYDVTHPFTQLEEARYLLKKEELGEGNYAKEALEIMEELDFEYSENPYVERIYAETLMENKELDKAKSIFEALLEADSDNYGAALGKAKCKFLQGFAEEAKEEVEDILEDRVQDPESLALLDSINEKLKKDYIESLEKEANREITFKLGWCYYQCKEFEKGIELLDSMEKGEDYDYINLRCRLYLANEDYEKALPYAEKWLKLIEESADDDSREMRKRKNRLSLAHFSIGVSMWEIAYKKKKQSNQKENIEKAVSYIQMSIKEETNVLVRLSYMEQLARFYLEDKKYEKAIALCNEIIEEDSGFYPAYVHRQKANYELKNAKEVIDDYFACKEIYPGYSRPYLLAAEVFMAFEQYDDVENIIEDGKEAELDSDGLELYQIKCLHYKEFTKESVAKALKKLLALKEKISNRTKENETDIEDLADVEKELAILYWDQDNVEKTIEIIDTYLKDHSDSVTMLNLKADVFNREKRYEEAIAVCKQLMQLDPQNIYVRMKLASCFERMDNTDKAIECYRMILAEDKNYVPAIRRMMYVYSYLSNQENDLGKCKKGIEYATRLIELTDSSEGYVERGNLYIDLYELEKAVEDCKKAIELDPEAYYAYNNLGCALLKLRRVEEAVQPLKQAIDIDPAKDHLPYMNLAECYILQEKYDDAIKAYKEVLKIRPQAFSINEEIAKIYVKKKEFAKAVSIYQKRLSEVEKSIKKITLLNRCATDDDVRFLTLNCKIADVFWQAGDLKKAEQRYSIVFNHCKKLVGIQAIKQLEDVAEFYRDTDRIDKAAKVMKFIYNHVRADEQKTNAYEHFSFTYATILAELRKQKEANAYANRFIHDLIKQYGSEKSLLSDRRYRSMHLYDLAIMKICAGDLDSAKTYLAEIKECHLCVTCETCDCFEYYFGMGLIAELENRKEDAGRFYRRAIEIKGNYPCAERHLKNL